MHNIVTIFSLHPLYFISPIMKAVNALKLEESYAWELLDAEIELELGRDVTLPLIQKLVDLYSLGIEYYESLHSYKYVYFQKRMNNLMMSPAIDHLTFDQSQSTHKLQTKESVKGNRMTQEELDKEVLYSAGDINETRMQEIIISMDNEVDVVKSMIERELEKQKLSIRDKIMRRKQASQLKISLSLIQLKQNTQQTSDASGRVSKASLKVDFSQDINESSEGQECPEDRKVEEVCLEQQGIQAINEHLFIKNRARAQSMDILDN